MAGKMNTQLAHFNKARQELAQATKIDEVKSIRDKAEALRAYMQQSGESVEMQNQCAEIKIRAERRAGEITIGMQDRGELEAHGGDRKTESRLHRDILNYADLGITPTQAKRWKQLANVPKQKFDAAIEDAKSNGDVLTSSMVRRVARQHRAKQEFEKPKPTQKKQATATHRIIHGDCIDEMKKLDARSVRLIFADPPYNIGVDYGQGKAKDQLSAGKYRDWCARWIKLCIRLLTEDGSLWLMINDEWADSMGVVLGEHGLHRRSWIKWYETFGVNCTNNFNRCSRHIFYCVKDPKNFVFNADAVRRPSDRQVKYNDKRATPDGKIWDNVWQIPRLTGTAKERIPDFPTQIPLAITRAIVGCASDPGDMVLDPFSGSASTGVAAIESGREYIGIEKNKNYCRLSKQRLQGV